MAAEQVSGTPAPAPAPRSAAHPAIVKDNPGLAPLAGASSAMRASLGFTVSVAALLVAVPR